jgi:hypothetical protein
MKNRQNFEIFRYVLQGLISVLTDLHGKPSFFYFKQLKKHVRRSRGYAQMLGRRLK